MFCVKRLVPIVVHQFIEGVMLHVDSSEYFAFFDAVIVPISQSVSYKKQRDLALTTFHQYHIMQCETFNIWKLKVKFTFI